MFAVVQIGSSERKSPCITARMVRAGEGCARTMPGAPEKAAAASVPWTKRRRVVRIETSLFVVEAIYSRNGGAGQEVLACPGRDAARSVAAQTRDPGFFSKRTNRGPGSAMHRYALHCVRDANRDSHNHPSLRQLGMRPDGAARLRERILARIERRGAFAVAVKDLRCNRRVGGMKMVGGFHANIAL